MATRPASLRARAVALVALAVLHGSTVAGTNIRRRLEGTAAPDDRSEASTTTSLDSSSSAQADSTGSQFKFGLIVPIAGTALLLVIGITCCCCAWYCCRAPLTKNRTRDSNVDRTAFISQSTPEWSSSESDPGASISERIEAQARDEGRLQRPSHAPPMPPREDYELSSDTGSDFVWRALQDDPNLTNKRLPYRELHFISSLSKGAFREVWVASYQGTHVVAKRLLKSRRSHVYEAQEFGCQIQLRAALAHPNIVQFVGVAWNSMANLTMVTEYLPLGDLENCLRYARDVATWENDKLRIATGVARALVYLHSRSPPVTHGDLKASNVLLTEQLEAKLIGFDSTRTGDDDDDSVRRVGTPFWTAPEVLRGEDYTEKADIYAFGVFLTELDTAKLPYHDAVSPTGASLQPVQVLNEVIGGMLRPSFSAECPRRIRVIGVGCCQQDPTRRPTAQQLLGMMEA